MEYEGSYIPPEENFTDDMPVKKGTLLGDNFAEGCMSTVPTDIINPVWEGITHAEMPRGKDGKRYWNKRGDGLYTLGDSKWADYEVNIDMAFNKDSHEQAEFMLQVRYQNISVYDKLVRYYGVSFRDGNKLVFEKYEAGGITISQQAVIPAYADRARHRLRVKLLDKNYEVYLDDKLLISGADDLRPVTYGSIALKFTDADMAIHLVEVLEVEDPVNGSADNYLLDYYDTPLPAHLEKYGYTNDQ